MILTKINHAVFLFETKSNVVMKHHNANNFKMKISSEFLMISRISTLCTGHYMQVIKSLGYHLSGCWSHCTVGHYIERSLT